MAGCEPRLLAGAGCTFSGDCGGGLVCIAARCRTECVTTRDCPIGARCLAGPTGAGRCSLPSESACTTGDDCGVGLDCVTSECRTRCTTFADCGVEQRCEIRGGGSTGTCVDVPPRDAGAPGDASGADASGTDVGACSAVPCSVSPQCGCAPGEACHRYFSLGTECLPAGSGYELATCGGPEDCAPGFECWTTLHTSICRAYCDTDADCAAGQLCDPSVGLCLGIACDPILGTGCPAGLGCLFFGTGARDYTDCVVPGDAAEGEVCVGRFACGVGLYCQTAACALLCDADADCGERLCLARTTSGRRPAPGFCADDCDPLSRGTCAPGNQCVVAAFTALDGRSVSATACYRAGSLPLGAPCSAVDDCIEGAGCHGSPLRCRAFCELGGAPCASGTCRDLGVAPVAGRRIGACE